MRVVHIVEKLESQAVENWLIRMMKHGAETSKDLDWTFYCTLGRTGKFDGTVREMGGKVIHSRFPLSEKRRFLMALRAELQNGRYDVLHCHHDVMSAPYLLAAAGLPIKKRIVHVHNADLALPTHSLYKKFLLTEPFRRVCMAADLVVGISHHTLDKMLDGRPRMPKRHRVHYYGVDPISFTSKVDRRSFRRGLGLSEDALILLFGGRIVPEKNPVHAVDVLAKLREREPRAVGVFAGAGSEVDAVRRRATELGVADTVKLIGWRDDLPAVMAACDWFILPRPEEPMEGFGLAVVEAQLAGLRLLLSRGIANDPLLPTARYRILGLAEGPDAWATSAVELLAGPVPSVDETIAALRASPMDMNFALKDLMELHAC